MYADNYTPLRTSALKSQEELIPVVSQWFGSWRIRLERRAYSVAELSQHYDRAANSWQKTLTGMGIPSTYELLAEDLQHRLDSTDRVTPIRVLDCGVGTGALSLALARTYPRRLHISAVDISPAMLDQTGRVFSKAGFEVELNEADIRKLPFESNTQDVVIAAHVLEHLADPLPALTEIHRVLKPGGIVLLCCTRSSLAGKWIQLKWRTHTVTPRLLERWLDRQNFEQIEPLQIDGYSHLQQLSIAYTAVKPTETLSVD